MTIQDGYEYRSQRYQWLRFLAGRDAELDSLAEIVILAQSIDDGAYSDERALKTLTQMASQQSNPALQDTNSPASGGTA